MNFDGNKYNLSLEVHSKTVVLCFALHDLFLFINIIRLIDTFSVFIPVGGHDAR